jgi:hypothetical protein
MPKSIGFRIVGMYFGACDAATGKIVVDVAKQRPTVYDVMVAVLAKVSAGQVPGVANFSFSPIQPAPHEDLASVTIEYTGSPKPKRGYLAGTYFLQDNQMSNPARVFQYYVFDENNVQLNNTNFDIPFNDDPGFEIKDNYTIVWRQVSILQGPISSPRVVSKATRAAKSLRS